MGKLTWEDKDGCIFVDGSDCYEIDLEGCVTVCSGEAIVKLNTYEKMHEILCKKIIEIKRSSNYPHNFTGQTVENLEWVLGLLN